METIKCDLCNETFSSKNRLFRHLTVHGYDGGEGGPKLEKICLLVGWISEKKIDDNTFMKDGNLSHVWTTENDRVENAIWVAIHLIDYGIKVDNTIRPKGFSRGSGVSQRATHLLSDEPTCHGVCDVFCFMAKPCTLLGEDAWVESLNTLLPKDIRVNGRIQLPKGAGDFHAESACTQRRYEYMIPLDIIMPQPAIADKSTVSSLSKVRLQQWCDMDKDFPRDTPEGVARIEFFRRMKLFTKALGGKRRVHNFATGGTAPDEAVSKRRIDRFYHKAIRTLGGKQWAVFSVSGDAFLRGQVRHMIGLIVALSRGWLPPEYLSSVLSEEVVIVPSGLGACLWLEEVKFAKWEAKHKIRLGPRDGDPSCPIERRAQVWRKEVEADVAAHTEHLWEVWERETVDKCSSLLRDWLALGSLRGRRLVPTFVQLEPPSEIFLDVLRLLRAADTSGLWPGSTSGRQKVIQDSTLSENGGRGGSFSVGVLPAPLAAPRGNELFPELVRACFLLEKKLLPDRRPSTTIAVNRHAQFRPHRDSGAGSGQSTSLIVGLGDYVGGELVVEGEARDIRYRAVEFDGWSERHWTLPFVGERFSLVWFTPSGAEDQEMFWLDVLV